MRQRVRAEEYPKGASQLSAMQPGKEGVATGWIAAASTCGDEELRECETVLLSCFRRIRRWRVPPRWSSREWFEEIAAELSFAALQASRDFDPERGVPRKVFLYKQIMHRAYTCYRREWKYVLRQAARAELEWLAESGGGSPFEGDIDLLQKALGRLPQADCCLVESLFWDDKTESELAKVLGVSQQAVNKRKLKVLNTLRRLLNQLGEENAERRL